MTADGSARMNVWIREQAGRVVEEDEPENERRRQLLEGGARHAPASPVAANAAMNKALRAAARGRRSRPLM